MLYFAVICTKVFSCRLPNEFKSPLNTCFFVHIDSDVGLIYLCNIDRIYTYDSTSYHDAKDS